MFKELFKGDTRSLDHSMSSQSSVTDNVDLWLIQSQPSLWMMVGILEILMSLTYCLSGNKEIPSLYNSYNILPYSLQIPSKLKHFCR